MKKISIIIPAYNEEKTIERVIKSVLSVKIPNYSKEIIVVNDASIDNTQKIIESYVKKKKIISLQHNKNLGKGAAIVSASKVLTGKVVIIQDADLEYDPQEIPRLVKAYDSHPTATVYGSRNLKKSNGYSYISYLMGNKFLNFVTNILYGINITDMETCYKLIPANIFKKINLSSRGFEIEPEITGKIAMLGCKIIEVPISYRPRSIEEGKKIRWTDGILALKKLISVRMFFN